jgi:DNA-binding FadR family transcriptional regulator
MATALATRMPDRSYRRQPEVEARSWLLFGEIAGESCRVRSRGIQVADDIEQFVARSGLRPGDRLGTERELIDRFSASRRLIRQATRALAVRGSLRIERGKNGGQLIAAVDRRDALDAFVAGVSGPQAGHQAAQALALVGDALSQRHGEAADFARAALLRLADGHCSRPEPQAGNMAEIIAQRIERDVGFWANGTWGNRSGALDAMCDHYSASLPIVIQAIRLLEDGGVLRLRRGRTGGIVPNEDRSARAIRVAHAHFVTHSVSVEECDSVVRLINIALIDQATRAEGLPHGPMAEALAQMQAEADATALGMRWYRLQRALSDLADNAPLHLLARCFAGFVVRFRPRSSELRHNHASVLLEESERIVAGVATQRNDGCADAHLRCQEALKSSW